MTRIDLLACLKVQVHRHKLILSLTHPYLGEAFCLEVTYTYEIFRRKSK